MDLAIADKWALVCGASKGLGFGCAKALAQEGVNLVINARRAEALELAVQELSALNPQIKGAIKSIPGVALVEEV